MSHDFYVNTTYHHLIGQHVATLISLHLSSSGGSSFIGDQTEALCSIVCFAAISIEKPLASELNIRILLWDCIFHLNYI